MREKKIQNKVNSKNSFELNRRNKSKGSHSDEIFVVRGIEIEIVVNNNVNVSASFDTIDTNKFQVSTQKRVIEYRTPSNQVT